MKITAGKFRGRQVVAPKGMKTRPSPARLREAVFNICQNVIEGASFLDLFSGSGVMSFEALSRGAKSATLVDQSSAARQAAKKNADILNVNIKILPNDALKFQGGPFTIIYADPPYNLGLGEKIVAMVDEGAMTTDILFIEEGNEMLVETRNIELVSVRRYGNSVLHTFKCR